MVDIMVALLGLGAVKMNVNDPNRGHCPDLPEGAVVETNTLLTQNDLTPLTAGRLPRQARNIVTTHAHNQGMLVKAGFAVDLDLAFQSFLNDQLVGLIDR